MFQLTDPIFWLGYIRYFFAVFVAYFIPGSLVIDWVAIDKRNRIPLSIVTGIVLFAAQGFIFGYFNVRFLTYVYLAVAESVWLVKALREYKKIRLPFTFRMPVIDRIALLIILLGSLIQLSTVWFSGIERNGAMYFCCGNQVDDLWYAGVSHQVTQSIPPQMPGLMGVTLHNYHYWSNIVVGETARIFGLPAFLVQIQYGSILLVILVPLLLYGFTTIHALSKRFFHWLLFFFYFGSDLTWLIVLMIRRASVFSMSSLEDGAGFYANIPRAYAVLVVFAILTLLSIWIKRRDMKLGIVLAVLMASLAGFKIYLGLFVYVGLIGLALYDITKKRWSSIYLGIMTAIFAACVYLPANSGAGGLYWTGLWRFRNFVVQPALNLVNLEQARLIFEADHKWYRTMVFDLIFAGLYIVATYGTKLIALLQSKKTLRQLPTELHIFIGSGLLASLILGTFVQQTVGGANSFNFLVTAFLFSSFYCALTLSTYLPNMNRIVATVLTVTIVVLTSVRIAWKVNENYRGLTQQWSDFPTGMVEAINFMKNETPQLSVFLVDRRGFYFDQFTPAFATLTDRSMYFSGDRLLPLFQPDPDELTKRTFEEHIIMESDNFASVAATLKPSNIDYLIIAKSNPIVSTTSAIFLDTVFDNDVLSIVHVDRSKIPLTVFGPEATTAGLFIDND